MSLGREESSAASNIRRGRKRRYDNETNCEGHHAENQDPGLQGVRERVIHLVVFFPILVARRASQPILL